MKRVKESLYEKFEETGDPVHQMGIGPQDTVYRCGNCGSILDANYDILSEKDEQFEMSQTIMRIFGENSDRVQYVWCNSCRQEEEDRQQEEEYQRWQEMQRERERFEEEQRWYEDNRY